jgi:hypothetical protein
MATFGDYLNLLTKNVSLVPQVINNVVRTGQIAPVGATPASTYIPPTQKASAPTTTFGQLSAKVPVVPNNGGGAVVGSGGNQAQANQSGIIGGAYEINPATGHQYAWNPKTGKFDINYYNQLIGAVADTNKLTTDQVSMLKQLSPANINYSDLEKKALEELTPYYTKLLDTYNGDIDMAKSHLKQQYELGLRQTRTNQEATQKENFNNVYKQEMGQTTDDLARRGLLGTTAGKQEGLSTTLSTGEKLGGEKKMAYGGLGGSRISLLQSSQQARNEAIQRAIKQKEEETGLQISQNEEKTTRSKQQKAQELEQQKRVEATQLGASRYQRALTQNQLKMNEILGA